MVLQKHLASLISDVLAFLTVLALLIVCVQFSHSSHFLFLLFLISPIPYVSNSLFLVPSISHVSHSLHFLSLAFLMSYISLAFFFYIRTFSHYDNNVDAINSNVNNEKYIM
jgi:hypothetical protein